ncbi:Hsp70 chaperone [Coemansia sp. RSA 2681]|nr:Hsp70 chaperone [Coemansia sp. RSA 2681]
MNKAIGIDLGTSYSRVAVWQDSRVEVLPNNHGNRATPSCVAFASSRRLIGDSALRQIEANPENTITNAKRLLGYSQLLRAEYKDEVQTLAAKDIAAALLSELRETAEAYLGTCAKDVVISVPACFTAAQCHATVAAAQLAGLNVLQLINDPTATAFALGHDARHGQTVLVLDMGGGTLDVSLLKFASTGLSFELLATAGSSQLGGMDFDSCLLAHLLPKVTKDVAASPHAIQRLRTACERAKRTLSTATIATIEIDDIVENASFSAQVTRSAFEELCTTLFAQVLEHVEAALANAGIPRSTVDRVVLLGGSTRIPKLRQVVAGYFGNKPLSTPSDNLDETVVVGAATQAAYLSSSIPDKAKDLILSEAMQRSSISASHKLVPKCH